MNEDAEFSTLHRVLNFCLKWPTEFELNGKFNMGCQLGE